MAAHRAAALYWEMTENGELYDAFVGCADLAPGSRVLAEPSRHLARPRRCLSDRLPGRSQSVSGVAGRARIVARSRVHQADPIWPNAEPLLSSLLGCPDPGGVDGGHSSVGGDRRRPARDGAGNRLDAGLVSALDPVSVDSQHRSDLLRVWMGVPASRGRLSRHLSGAGHHRPAHRRDLDVSLVAVSGGVWSRPDQAARRSLLARSHLPQLPPRDPADAESTQLVLPPSAEAAAQGRSCRQSRRPADCPDWTGLPAAGF